MVLSDAKRQSRVLRSYAEKYETASFIEGDPSWFMHQVSGMANQEVTAFIAACLSYGSREQFVRQFNIFRPVRLKWNVLGSPLCLSQFFSVQSLVAN